VHTFVDNGSSATSTPKANSAGSTSLSSAGLSTYQLRLNGQLLTGNVRAYAWPAILAARCAGHLLIRREQQCDGQRRFAHDDRSDYFNHAPAIWAAIEFSGTIQAGTLLVIAGASVATLPARTMRCYWRQFSE